MTYHGHVENGIIVLDPPAALPEGSEVEITARPAKAATSTWAEVFKDFIGKAEGLPSDSSRNHDHYLYGAPKQ